MNRNREFSFKQIHDGLNKEGSSSIEALQKLISGKINQLNSQFDSLSVKYDEQSNILFDNNRQTFENELEKVNYFNEKEQFLYDNNISQYDSYEEYLESDINESESNFESEGLSRQKKITTNPFSNLQVQNNKRISLLTKGEKVDSMIEENGREEGDYEIYSEPQSPSPRHRNTIQFHRKTTKAKTISTTNYDESLLQSGSSIGNLMKLAIQKRSATLIRESPSIHNSNSNDSGDDNTEEDSQSDYFQDNNEQIQEELDQSGALSKEEISINQEDAKEELQEHFKFSLEGTFLGQSIGKPIKKYSFPLEFRNKNTGMDEKIREKFLLIQNYQHLLQLETTSFSSNQYDQNMLSKQIIPNHPEFLAVKNNCKSNNKNQTQDLETLQDSKFASVDYYKGRLSKCYSQNIYGQVSSESLNNILQTLSESLQQRDREKTSFHENKMHEKNLQKSLAGDKRGDKRLILDQTEEPAVPVFSLSFDLINNDCIPRKEKIINVPVLDISPKKILKRNRNDSSSPNPRHHHQSVQKSVTYFQSPEIDLVTNNLSKNSRLQALYSKSMSFKTDNANPLL